MLASDTISQASAADDSEARLVNWAKERRPSAWAEIYDTHYRKLFRYCYARCGNEVTAADLVSKVYLGALEGIDRYEYRGRPLLAWLYRIAHNVVVDHFRANDREGRVVERVAAHKPSYDPGPADEVDSRHDIANALTCLTNEQRRVIELRYYGSLTTSEIALAMDKTERAVYSLEVRALAALRRALLPEAQNVA